MAFGFSSSRRCTASNDRALLEIARVGFSDLRRLFHQNGRLKHPDEWDDDTAASVASVEVVTRSLGDGVVEYVSKLKLWDKGKALEQLCKHLALYRDQGQPEQPGSPPLSEQPGSPPLSDISDEGTRQPVAERLHRELQCAPA
jgi:phage terminase small subunit